MGRKNAHLDNPLQYLRTILGKKQQDFADLIGIGKSELAKREISAKGFEVMPPHLHKKLARELGVTVVGGLTQKPGPGYYRQPVGFGGVPFTKEYYEEHCRDRVRKVLFPPKDVIKALTIIAEVTTRMRREDQFADTLKILAQTFCASIRFKNEISNKVKDLIAGGKEEDQVAAYWLCQVLEDHDLKSKIPTLPTVLDHDKKVVKKMKEKFPGGIIYVKGEPEKPEG